MCCCRNSTSLRSSSQTQRSRKRTRWHARKPRRSSHLRWARRECATLVQRISRRRPGNLSPDRTLLRDRSTAAPTVCRTRYMRCHALQSDCVALCRQAQTSTRNPTAPCRFCYRDSSTIHCHEAQPCHIPLHSWRSECRGPPRGRTLTSSQIPDQRTKPSTWFILASCAQSANRAIPTHCPKVA